MRFFGYTSRESEVRFCDSCSRVCERRCRLEEAREWAIERAIAGRFGF